MDYLIKHIDNDGHASAAILYNHYMQGKEVKVIPYNYANPDAITSLPLQEGDFVYITDISFKENTKHELDYIISKVGIENIIWIDHHQSSIDFIKRCPEYDTIKGVRSNAACATVLAWYYINNNICVELPYFIQLINDHDLWIYKLKDTSAFNYGTRSIYDINDCTSETWSDMIEFDAIGYIIRQGQALADFNKEEVERLQKSIMFRGFFKIISGNNNDIQIDKLSYVAMNAVGNSALFGNHYNTADISILFNYVHGIAKPWKYTLFTHRKDLQLHKLAELYGGGGHPGACGFSLSESLFKGTDTTLTYDMRNIDIIAAPPEITEIKLIY